ncbi:MAG: uroporphyrinogen decarboxylase family protein [Clostridia bacterium]
MNGYERTVRFVKGEAVDRPPFMPLVIEWVSRTQGIAYPDFVYDPEIRAQAYERCVEQYDLDCVLPDADFYEQLEDFGAKPVYDGKGYSAAPIIEDVEDLSHLTLPEYSQGSRMGNCLEILRRVAAKEKGKRYIFGICIGPLTEFCNARTTEEAMCDLLSEEEAAQKAIDIFFENGMRFIEAQLEAGADGIQIVEPCCSLISPELYARLILPYHKKWWIGFSAMVALPDSTFAGIPMG